MTTATALDERKLQELEEKFDPEMRFRATVSPATWIVMALLIALSLFHYYTAGFGLLRETTHRGVHLAFVLGLIFLVFPRTKRAYDGQTVSAWHSPGGVPLSDWLLAIGCAVSVLYIPYVFDDLAFRVGNPSTTDIVFGSILFFTLIEATRRAMGWPLPLIAIGFTLYALAGPYFPGLLILLSCFHYYTAGFGLLRETTHRGIHMAFVLGLVFLVFPWRKSMLEAMSRNSCPSPMRVASTPNSTKWKT